MSERSRSVLWLRKDLRLRDHPALIAAAEAATEVVVLHVLDPADLATYGESRRAYLAASLRALDAQLGGRLVVRSGHPEEVVPAVVREAGAGSVHVSADTTPAGRARDERIAAALPVPLVTTGSPYAVGPGRVLTGGGTPYQVFTPFLRAWAEHGWAPPAPEVEPRWAELTSETLPAGTSTVPLPEAGELAALERWEEFRTAALADYPVDRDRPDRPGTSFLSIALACGEIHPRTLLADLADAPPEAAASFRAELAWREFHADVLWHRPDALTDPLRAEYARMEHDEPGTAFDAWCEGRTGFPLVDAGMRQLLATGWMHNRVRMVTASFLVKDLHVHWTHGARFFLDHLLDADLAQNQLNWQWVAGCGADASPWFRIFNPTAQQRRFDPQDHYVRRWVPELGSADYPDPIVDHAAERREALARRERMRP
ncbi:deoxyribodipyrimidine photo-lyase [Nocardioides sp.]|uniref:cryptochrome/photolyase family protein n=1 Tax=Nocardioides sp. TaxID=35761 RepID=UPI002C677FF3|nr:deoxyribodipyrimidine photo-lyase [Nocardioides sp.]HSX68955.1 deoxyribodipyrimidine photo-lyase [Nocardioides sp.]